ncbi:MAG: FMN-binding protein, partial [Planctomycetes bacterium]|nr:FMN-binding protein [Planctomycetota bacterium]
MLHFYRWAVFVVIIWLIHQQHQWYTAQLRGQQHVSVSIDSLKRFYPQAAELAEFRPGRGGRNVTDAEGKVLGYVITTSPESDSIIGYSGPTDTLVAFDPENRILGLDILRSGDTPEHVQAVRTDELFMTSFNGLTWDEAARKQGIDGASGATLTSLAIAEGIIKRLGGTPHSGRFPEPVRVDEVRTFFPEAAGLVPRMDKPGMLDVVDADGRRLGSVFRTTPEADELVGFQGPTDTLVALDTDDRVVGFAVHSSYETPEYVGYVREDKYFRKLFNGQSLGELAAMDTLQVEGVSGATMTSQVMAQGIAAAAKRLEAVQPPPPRRRVFLKARDVGTALVVVFATVMAFTSLRGKKPLRIVFQIVLIVYLGFVQGDLISQALIVGWSQSGVPWRFAPGLVV